MTSEPALLEPAAAPAVAPAPATVERLVRWLTEDALPLWAERGWDRRGGFVERLGDDGSPDLDAVRRLRVQARQIYVFASAAATGWFPEGRAIALAGLDYLIDRGWWKEGGYVRLLTPEGCPADGRRLAYDQAFVLLALAAVLRLTDEARLRAEIDRVIAFLDGPLAADRGGCLDALPATPADATLRSQNPHMHLFEAMLALHEATGEAAFLARASEIYGLFRGAFFDPASQTLGEFFTPDWQPAPGRLGDIVEPGHQAEWVWLLGWYHRLTGRPVMRQAESLMRSALRYASPQTGLLADEGDRSGRVVRASSRCWPQIELAKAWLAMAEAGVAGAGEQALAALQRVERHYFRPHLPGTWFDQFDAAGRSLEPTIPASTFYHLFSMVAEADRVLGPRRAQ